MRLRDRYFASKLFWIAVSATFVAMLVAPEHAISVAPQCIFSSVFGTRCWGCGMTRALVALLQGHWGQAIEYHRMVIVVAPLLGIAYLRWTLRTLRRPEMEAS